MSHLTLEEKIAKFPVICYSRVVGWLTPTKNYNLGKAAEWADRKFYSNKKAVEDLCKDCKE